MNRITDFDRLTTDLNLSSVIESYLWEELTGEYWETIEQMVDQLESASCSAGSWSDFIYTRDILDRLADSKWLAAIDEALAEYMDSIGESYRFESLEETVTFAVDWSAHTLADKLRNLNHVAVVWVYADTMDSWPEGIAFGSYWEADDFASEEIQRRVQYRVDHSPYTVSEEEIEQWQEQESQLIIIKDERL